MDPQIERSRHFLTWAMDGKPNSKISLNHPQFHERRLEISLQNTTTKDFRIRRFFGISDAPIIRLIHPGFQWLIPQFSKKGHIFFKSGDINPLTFSMPFSHPKTRHFPTQIPYVAMPPPAKPAKPCPVGRVEQGEAAPVSMGLN